MNKYVVSTDQSNIHYKETGQGKTTLVFVHGWLGNINWWNSQQIILQENFKVVQIDLGGHGKSDKTRKTWTSKQYVDDIKAVIDQLNSSEIILIGHSMSGAYALEASLEIPNIKSIILVDTLKDLDQTFTPEQAEKFMYSYFRQDFKSAVENILPQHLFVETTPPSIKQQVQNEFLENNSDLAINALEPLYKMDVQSIAKKIKIPIRAINSDSTPTNIENNRKYLKDFNAMTIIGTGHYPMLENPTIFNNLLLKTLEELMNEK